MTTLRARRFARLDRIAARRAHMSFTVVAPTTFRGLVWETITALVEHVRIITKSKVLTWTCASSSPSTP